MFQREVLLEEVQTSLPVYLLKQPWQFVPSSENPVELAVSEAYDTVILYTATVVNLINIRPHTRTEAHVARLSGSIKLAAAQIEAPDLLASLPYRYHLPVKGRILILHHLIVSGPDYLAVLHDDCPEWTAIPRADAFQCLIYGHLHILVFCCFHITPILRISFLK